MKGEAATVVVLVAAATFSLSLIQKAKRFALSASVNSSAEDPWEGTSKCTRRTAEAPNSPTRRRAAQGG